MFENISFSTIEYNKEMFKYSVEMPSELNKIYRGELYLKRDTKTKIFTSWTFRLGHMIERSITLDEMVFDDVLKGNNFFTAPVLNEVRPILIDILNKSINKFITRIDERILKLNNEIENIKLEILTNKESRSVLCKLDEKLTSNVFIDIHQKIVKPKRRKIARGWTCNISPDVRTVVDPQTLIDSRTKDSKTTQEPFNMESYKDINVVKTNNKKKNQ